MLLGKHRESNPASVGISPNWVIPAYVELSVVSTNSCISMLVPSCRAVFPCGVSFGSSSLYCSRIVVRPALHGKYFVIFQCLFMRSFPRFLKFRCTALISCINRSNCSGDSLSLSSKLILNSVWLICYTKVFRVLYIAIICGVSFFLCWSMCSSGVVPCIFMFRSSHASFILFHIFIISPIAQFLRSFCMPLPMSLRCCASNHFLLILPLIAWSHPIFDYSSISCCKMRCIGLLRLSFSAYVSSLSLIHEFM